MIEEEVVATTVLAAPGIYIAIQVVKMAVSDWMPAKFWPLIAVTVGIALQVGWTVGTDAFGRESIFLGMMSGAAATGLHNIVEVTRDAATSIRNGGTP